MSPTHIIELFVGLLAVVGVVTAFGAMFSLGRGKSYDE